MTDSTDPASGTVARARSQGGYILATVLGLMVLSLMLLAALLAVTQSTMRIEQTGRVRERQARAAESAVQVAINQVRNSATIATANPLNRKQSGDPGYLTGEPTYKQPISVPGDANYTVLGDPNINRAAAGGVCIPPTQLINIDSYPVRVFCYPQDLSQYDRNGNTIPGIPQDDGSVAVRLVGDQYQGDTTTPGLTDVAANWKTSFPFSSAMSGFNQGEVNSTKGQLLYTGAVPMKVVGGVQVRNQIAAVASSGSGPALEVQGPVRQGGKGMFDAGPGPLDCGIAKSNDPNNSPRADIRTDSLFLPVAEGLQCNQADMASMAQTGATSPDGEWDNDRVQRNRYNTDWQGNWDPTNPSIPYAAYLDNANVPTDCDDFRDSVTHDPAHVIVIEAGAYDARSTKLLNAMFTGCDNRTWIFPGGNYWFDVNDTSPVTAALPANDPSRHSLVFNNRTSNWVFGPPINSPVLNPGWPPNNAPWSVENFPQACDHGFASGAPDTSRGTSITLSSRTGLYHRAGRVAVCGPIGVKPTGWDGKYPQSTAQSTAIFQRPSTPLGARLLPTGLNAGDFTAGTAPLTAATINADDGSFITAQQWMPYQWWDGNSTFTKTFTATGFGSGSPNTSGPDAVNSVWVDVTGSGDRVNGNLTKTHLDVTLADGTTCSTEYGPNPSDARRLPSNNLVTSYDLLDSSASGNCASQLGSKTRDKFYGANIKATFTLNPPYMRNTKFSWWDWWPWFRDQLEAACRIYDAWGVGDWLNNHIGLIDWYWRCDDRPSQVTYSVNSIVLRLGWSPDLGVPVDGLASAPPWNYVAVQNPANATRANPGVATIATPPGFAQSSTFSILRYTLQDPTLLDGFLSMQTINFGYKMTKNTGFQGSGGTSLDNNDDNVVQFTLKQNVNDGIWCRKTVRIDGIPFDGATTVKDSGTFRPSDTITYRADNNEVLNGCINKVGLGPMIYNGSNQVTDVEVDQFISHYDHPSGGNLQPSYLDVEVKMANRGTSKALTVDYVTMSATAGVQQGSNLVGYPKPLAPFTVTWSPLTPNPGGDGAIGDATFNVWGSVSVPNNDVRVIWNYDQSRAAGQTGFPMFNSGKSQLGDCYPVATGTGTVMGDPNHCQPALVASALGSWTTMTNNGYPVGGSWPTLSPNQIPDPLASTGFVRPAVRNFQVQACVVDSTGGGVNGSLLPRVVANVAVNDRDPTNAVVPGASVWIKQWQSLRAGAFEPTADALTNDCATSY